MNLVGPVSPVWCPVPKPSQPHRCPKRGEVDFIGKWFLQEVQMATKIGVKYGEVKMIQ